MSKFFDPFGRLVPVIMRMKMLFQHLWRYYFNGDVPLPALECIASKDMLHCKERIRVKRLIPHTGEKSLLHGFADASETAYAAVVYARNINHGGGIVTNLAAANTARFFVS